MTHVVQKTRTADSSSAPEASEALVLGQRIRRLRVADGKSLRAQAREIGIAPSSLSALETGRGGVSLKRLQLVAEHYGLHITDLLGGPTATVPDQVEVIRDFASTVPGVRRGQGVLYQLLGSGRNRTIQPYLLSFEAGGTYERDMIAHSGEEFAVVLYGEVELVMPEQRYRLSQGDMVRFPTEQPHAFRNTSTFALAVVIGAATPPW